MLQEINGDLITLAKAGEFDVIGHGCNCFCTMKSGIAPQMAEAFGCDNFPLESPTYKNDLNKLGQIDFRRKDLFEGFEKKGSVYVVNMYTQYHWREVSRFGIPLDYTALELCLVKMNSKFEGLHIGLPKIGCGLAGGDWNKVAKMIDEVLTDCRVTIVNYVPE